MFEFSLNRCALGIWLAVAAAPFAAGQPVALDPKVHAVLKEYCLDCHNNETQKGDVNLAPIVVAPNFDDHHEMWEKVADLMRNREMPPEKKPQPSEDQRHSVVAYIDAELNKLASGAPSPGRVTLRRLNKEEYRRTIWDLLRVEFDPKEFPTDEVGYGFNNIGDVLSLSPMQMEKYMAAAEEIARKALPAQTAEPASQRIRGERFRPSNEDVRALGDRAIGFYREGHATYEAEFLRRGEHLLKIRAWGDLAGPEPPRMEVKLGGKEVDVVSVKSAKRETYELRVKAEAGRHALSLGYLNNWNEQSTSDPKLKGDRNLFVESVEIVGPLDGRPAPASRQVDMQEFRANGRPVASGRGEIVMASEMEAVVGVELPVKDEYVVKVRATAEQAGNEPAKMRVSLDGKDLGVFEVKATRNREETFQVRFEAEAGKRRVGVAFINDFYDPQNPDPRRRDRNLYVRGMELIGPINTVQAPESQQLLLSRVPAPGEELAVAKEVMAKFARRAYRRPVRDEEVARLVNFVDLAMQNGGSFVEGLQVAIQAALCSPHFLFRWELDSEALKPGEIRHLGDFEVASRLSYFLWSTMPDEELFALAEKGELLKNGNIEKQIARMLKDPKAQALVENFGGQWLQVHNIYEVDPDPAVYPKFTNELREDMKKETFAFFEAIMKEDRSILDLMDSDFTFLNERLAKHYGIEGVTGSEFRRVTLPPDSPRGGVLTQGSVLLATSMPTRTSPVIRGKWILEQILGTPPPPAPAGVPPLEDKGRVDQDAPLRKRLEQHRLDPDCAGCHAKIDPLGFALENFDAVGAWRTTDGKWPVDAQATLPGDIHVTNPKELKQALRNDKFARSLAQKMMIYALGRGLERYDRPALDRVLALAKEKDYKFSALVSAIVNSDPFLKRQTQPKQLANN